MVHFYYNSSLKWVPENFLPGNPQITKKMRSKSLKHQVFNPAAELLKNVIQHQAHFFFSANAPFFKINCLKHIKL